jgi:hypothetical protein
MWVFTNNAFVSIVAHRDKPGTLLVRGRFKGDVDRFLRRKCEIETPDADYRFRAESTFSDVARLIEIATCDINYPNFKDSMREPWRKRIAMSLWGILANAQRAISIGKKP